MPHRQVFEKGLQLVLTQRLVANEAAVSALEARELEPGPPGEPGKDGERGPAGPRGAAGLPGEQGAIGPMPRHEWRGTSLRFEIAPDTWGKWKDLQGPAGKPGVTRVLSGGGQTTDLDLARVPVGEAETEPSDVLLAQAGRLVRLPWASFLSILQSSLATDATPQARRVDFVRDGTVYRGEATPGASEDAPVWRIRKITFAADGDISEIWANGSDEFAHVWTDREELNFE